MENVRPEVNRGKLVTVEGVDLVGKTTLAKSLAGMGWQYYYTPQPPFGTIRQSVEDLGHHPTRFFYYLAAVVAVQTELRQLLEQGNVVVDRYIDSTFVMHQALGVDLTCINRQSLPILVPDLTLVLTAERGTRIQRRLDQDDQSAYDVRIEQSCEIGDRAQALFCALGQPIIDTTILTKTEVLDQALAFLTEVGHEASAR